MADQYGRPVLPISNNERVGKKNSKEKERKQFTHASPREEQVLYFTLFSWLFLSPAPVK